MTCILITGASSGIGFELSKYYAAPKVTLILTGRDEKRLGDIQKECKSRGATVIAKAIDVTDRETMEKWLVEIDEKHPIDLIIANAGIPSRETTPTLVGVTSVLNTNILGVVNTIMPLIPPMKDRGHGQIAVISSLAAYRAYPGRGAYTASKAASKMLCEAWRLELETHNISVTAVCPGFIKTPLTATAPNPLPLLMEADKAAEIIGRGIAKRKAVLAFPWPLFLLVRLMQCLPVAVADFIIRRSMRRIKT